MLASNAFDRLDKRRTGIVLCDDSGGEGADVWGGTTDTDSDAGGRQDSEVMEEVIGR